MLKSHNKTILEILGRNPIHPFPARMSPGIALEALGRSKRRLRVLDPMTGSGTVLAVARSKGHQAYGVDLDPLAVLLARVWTRTIRPALVRKRASRVLTRAKALAKTIASRNAYPEKSDDETRGFVRYWFDDYTRKQLAALAIAIRQVRERAIRDVMWCGFSRLIITKSAGASLAMDLSHSRPHKEYERAPIKPFNKFIASVDTVIANCPQSNAQSIGPRVIVKNGDARRLSISNASMDLVLTSPPYLNAIDYMRCSKFSLVWMGYTVRTLRDIRSLSIGSEKSLKSSDKEQWLESFVDALRLTPKLSNRDHELLLRYVSDMSRALAEVSRVLKPGGRAVYVVGDSNIKGTFVRNSTIVKNVAANNGLTLTSQYSRQLPANRRYLPPPKMRMATDTMSARMRREVVMVFDKRNA